MHALGFRERAKQLRREAMDMDAQVIYQRFLEDIDGATAGAIVSAASDILLYALRTAYDQQDPAMAKLNEIGEGMVRSLAAEYDLSSGVRRDTP